MNFFDAQDHARRSTRRLILLFALATLTIVAGVSVVVLMVLTVGDSYDGATRYGGYQAVPPGSAFFHYLPGLLSAASITLIIIVGASLIKILSLASAGGSGIAEAMGGKRVNRLDASPEEVRLHNIVEEMAIASGVPVPDVYVLQEEGGINAFAAGFSSNNAAVAVTRGALNQLDRDELQGVIAHEFSHILNGDMRLNIRLMGVLYGILVIGLGGRLAVRLARHADNFRAGAALFTIGAMLSVLGYTGLFFGRMIKAGVSRQREYLADASAVQFTRQTRGIAGALWKIGKFPHHSYINEPKAEEVSHMLFANGALGLARMFATHPPLDERIRALDPSFDASSMAAAAERFAAGESLANGLAAAGAPAVSLTDQVGSITEQAIEFAGKLRMLIPDNIYESTQRPEPAYLLALATLLADDDSHRRQQVSILQGMLGDWRTQCVLRFSEQLDALGSRFRIPLLELAGPALRQLEPESQLFVDRLLDKVIEADNKLDLREYCIASVIRLQLPALKKDRRGIKPSAHAVRQAQVRLLGAIAAYGHAEPKQQQAAFNAAMQRLDLPADGERYEVANAKSMLELKKSIGIVTRARFAEQQQLIDAISRAVLEDGEISIEEYELVRVICMTLNCPLPPFMEKLPATE
jgi:Zn-dependent protease with chaperone function